ncbi:MAG: transporter substrate-binding domain-containing protein [Rubrivivax sp.]|nr:transporter substrate-binding domain-containing protein [Rubrivivax sp.]
MRLFNILTRRLALHALLAGAVLLAGCATTGVAPEIRQALAPTGKLRIAVYEGSPTSLVRGPGADEMRGLSVDIGREMARRLGVPAEVVVYERVPAIVAALKEGKADFTITNASPARARDVDFTPAVVGLETGYLVPANSPIRAFDAVDRSGVRVGVSQGSTSQGVLTKDLKQARVVPAASVTAATQMLRQGELDAFATNKGILFEMADKLPGSRVLDGRWGLENLAIAVPKGREAGAGWLKAFAADVAEGGQVQQAASRAGLRGTVAPSMP